MENLEEFAKEVLKEVVRVTKAGNALPQAGDEFEYYSSFPGFKVFSSKIGLRINKLIGKILEFEDVTATGWPGDSAEDVDEVFDALVEANDCLLERVSTLLDEASTGKKKDSLLPGAQPESLQRVDIASWNKMEHFKSLKFSSANIPRPQAKFRDMVDNSPTPFIPMLFSKPNQLKPLPEVFSKLQSPKSLQTLIENSKEWSKSPERCVHPYLYEIQVFEPSPHQTVIADPKPPGTLDEVPLIMVDTPGQLQDLVSTLATVDEFAVDLEEHSYRSFQGFLCLMQVSTRNCDYIIDTLELRSHMQILNEVFTNPRIVKVFHGADWDVQWLQRDFGVYIVNLFDTGQASRVLGLPRYSLAFLLDYCCGVQADKQYQLADWRLRPLPPEMIKYAREDTHYLLYIYDRMRNELIRRSNANKNMLHSVIDRSREIAMRTYEKPLFHKDGYLSLCQKFKRSLNKQQLSCLKLLCKWRDNLARREDESMGYVLPNHMLFQISEVLPREPQGVLACCNPVPTMLRQHLNEVFTLVQQARHSQEEEEGDMDSDHDDSSNAQNESLEMEEAMATDIVDKAQQNEVSRSYTINISKVGVVDPVVSAIKSLSTVVPEHVKKCLDTSQMKFTNLLGMFLPAGSKPNPLTTRVTDKTIEQPPVSEEVKVFKEKTRIKRIHPLRDPPTVSSETIKKSKIDKGNEDFTPFDYSQGFSQATKGKTEKKREFNPSYPNPRRPSQRRSYTKQKSSKSNTSKTTTDSSTKTIEYKWPN